jgi:hypothetical protein
MILLLLPVSLLLLSPFLLKGFPLPSEKLMMLFLENLQGFHVYLVL